MASLRGKGGNLRGSPTLDRAVVDRLYERNAGRLFAYCLARLGSRNVAEWAVAATFDRAGAALANGSLDENELDWLLRTADKFCGPRLRLGAGITGDPYALVLRDWHGLSFDEIEAELQASKAALETARTELSPWRRLLGSITTAPAWLKDALGGTSAVQAIAAAVAVTGAIVVVATPVATMLHDAVAPSEAKPAARGVVQPGAPAVVHRSGGGPASATHRARHGGAAGAVTLPATTPARVRGHRRTHVPAGGGSQAPVSTLQGAPVAGVPLAAAGASSGASSSGPSAPTGSSAPSLPALTTPKASQPTVSLQTPTVSSPLPTVSSPTVTVPTVTAPTVSAPTATLPTVSAPTVTAPTVTAPTATLPTVSAPTATAPTVTVPTLP